MVKDYKIELAKMVDDKQRTVLTTTVSEYFRDSIEVLTYLTKKLDKRAIIVTFDTNLRDIVEALEDNGVDIGKLHAIDAISLISGRGTPPVHKLITVYKPTNFSDIEVYTHLFLKKMNFENVFVFFLSLHNLTRYENQDEIGIFLRSFRNNMERFGVPEIVISHQLVDHPFMNIVSANVEQNINIRTA